MKEKINEYHINWCFLLFFYSKTKHVLPFPFREDRLKTIVYKNKKAKTKTYQTNRLAIPNNTSARRIQFFDLFFGGINSWQDCFFYFCFPYLLLLFRFIAKQDKGISSKYKQKRKTTITTIQIEKRERERGADKRSQERFEV